MTQEEYDRSIATGELQLHGFWEKLSHFGLVFFLLFIPAAYLFFDLLAFLRDGPSFIQPGDLTLLVIPLILSGLVFFLQKKRLKFQVIQTSLTREQIEAIINQVSVELEWKGNFITKKIYQAKTYPSFWSGSWGEQITILLSDNRVFVNSICDLDKRSSMVSFGRNRENEDTVIVSIKRAEQIVAGTLKGSNRGAN